MKVVLTLDKIPKRCCECSFCIVDAQNDNDIPIENRTWDCAATIRKVKIGDKMRPEWCPLEHLNTKVSINNFYGIGVIESYNPDTNNIIE